MKMMNGKLNQTVQNKPQILFLKADAMKRARNIADNRETEIIEHKKNE